MLSWVQQFGTFCLLDNHQYRMEPHSQECLLAAGVKHSILANAGQALVKLEHFIEERKTKNKDHKPGWLFGHLGYDLKNELEELHSLHADQIGFPDLFFFEPQVLIRFSGAGMFIEAEDPTAIFKEIDACPVPQPQHTTAAILIQQRISREKYISIIQRLQQHILRGDCYEINFCQEFFAEKAFISPLELYNKLSQLSPNPFSALYRLDQRWLICASPERFIRKQGNTILSQPIKGTSRRIPGNAGEDHQSKIALHESAKDRSENVMVVDLVRNDLARVCEEGSVKVEELFGVYTFPQVHQMLSTVSGDLIRDIKFTDIIRAVFPMGSMTGAPKKRVMELIEQYEQTRRGIFSGALGYISPEGDFDFNVVIRSMMYNAASGYLSFQTGSGITFYSDAANEWDECLLKAEAMKKVLGSFG